MINSIPFRHPSDPGILKSIIGNDATPSSTHRLDYSTKPIGMSQNFKPQHDYTKPQQPFDAQTSNAIDYKPWGISVMILKHAYGVIEFREILFTED